jgi:hypothetical protein
MRKLKSMTFRGVRPAAAGLLIGLAACASASAQSVESGPNPGVPWPATDALGRHLPTATDGRARPPRADRFVGIFYFLWHDNHGGKRPGGDGPYDVSKIFARDADALHHPASPLWGPIGMYHYWAEPLYGYYLSTDPWVIRRHAQLLTAAGIDTLIFDTTNTESYPHVYMKLCKVFSEMRESGSRTPQISFMVNTDAGATAKRIYKNLYQAGLFRDLWFRWQGKPLLICDPKEASPELRSFFTLRRAHWPTTQVNTRDAWHWEATYPQVYGYTDDPAKPEQVNVSVAQNLRVSDGRPTNMSAGDARGRSFHDGARDQAAGAVALGHNFHEQWRRAIDLDPPFVMVTGWNEWIAGRWGKPGGPIEFVDQFDQELSRDIEPMKRGHADNYYYQLVANVRRFKGEAPLPSKSPARSITINGDFDQWKDVTPEFRDEASDTAPRDHDGAGGQHYVNRTGRNDLIGFKVAHDALNVSFYARTREKLTPPTGPNWMWLLIDADCDPRTGWEGYEYIVNRRMEGAGITCLERNEGGWAWKNVAQIPYHIKDHELHLSIPRSALAVPDHPDGMIVDFKWVDNTEHPGDIMDFYVSGDVAPVGRFRYRYTGEPVTPRLR